MANPGADFDSAGLVTQDVGSMASRDWLPLMKGEIKGARSLKRCINLAHGQRIMATLHEFAKRGNDIVNYTIDRTAGLVRKGVTGASGSHST